MTRDKIMELAKFAWGESAVTMSEGPINTFASLAETHERERCCSLIFGMCESDNVAQRTVDAIRKGKS